MSWVTQNLNLITVEFSNQLSLIAAVAIIASILVGESYAAVVVELMLGSGELLENIIFNKASTAISKLIEAYPKKANVIRDGREIEISISEITLGERVIIKPGGIIPIDGRVINGHATVNQSSVTGESIPIDKIQNDEVFSGTLVEQGVIEIETTAIGDQSTYGRIIRLVQEAEENKAPIVSLADRFAGYYIPIILLTGVLIFVFTSNPLRMASVFIVACPCALTLATPTAIVASISNSARKGILIRKGESLENLERIDTLVFDKTGTVTLGNPVVLEIKGYNGENEKEVLRVAAGAERFSEHSLAKAVLKRAEKEGVSPLECSDFEAYPGMGICVTESKQIIRVGNEKMMKENLISLPDTIKSLTNLEETINTVIYVARDTTVIGSLIISDAMRDDVADVLSDSKCNGVDKIVMLTGDKQSVADNIGKGVGFDVIVADLLPNQKVEYIKGFQKEGRKVLMVGDGINDAPALATADVGVAMGLSGTDVAIETAGITLATNRLDRIPMMLKIGKSTMKIIKLNIFFAMIMNVIGVTLSVLGYISPIFASIVHEGSAVIVMLNTLRLLKVD
jgi:heavy metal translocating P-type ATPase